MSLAQSPPRQGAPAPRHARWPAVGRAAAWLLLAGMVVASSAWALRYYDGHDFINNIWAPTRGLLAGYNPYDPSDIEYLRSYPVPVVAGLYVPTALALHAPLALLSRVRTADVIALLNTALIWLGVLLLIPPRSGRACLLAAVAGAMVVLSAPAQHTIFLGQLSAWAFAGLALVVASLRHDPGATWLPAIGVTFVALKPQSAVPMMAGLAVLGYWRVLGRAAAIVTVTSVPGVVLFLRAAGSGSAVLRTVRDNLASLLGLPPDNLANPGNLRIDALGIVSRFHGPVLDGLGWTWAVLVLATGLLYLVLRAGRDEGPRTLADPYLVTLVALYVDASVYHLTYDELLLYVGPLAALGVIEGSKGTTRATRIVALGGLALIVFGFAFRSGFRNRLINLGLPQLTLHQVWVTIPTLLSAAIIAGKFLFDRRPASAPG